MAQSDGKSSLQRMTFEFQGQSYDFAVNPQEFQQQEASRSTITQTKGGAWVDDFGPALPTIYMKGMTGFAKGQGFDRWKKLRDTLRAYYNSGLPGLTLQDELIFHNLTDEESWVVHLDPNSGFKLYRSVSNPLIYQYEIYMVCLRKADDPGSASSSGVSVGNPFGSSLPKASQVPNIPSTQLYLYGMPYLSHVMSSNSSGQISNSVADYAKQPTVLSNGSVQIVNNSSMNLAPKPLFGAGTSVSVDPVLTPQVSNLSVKVYNSINTGNSPYTCDVALDETTLIYKIMNNENIGVTNQMKSVLQFCILELASVNYALINNPNDLSKYISQEDLARLTQNLRWVTNQLAGVANFDLSIVEGLRWVERCVQYIFRTDSLFAANVTQSLTDYQSALIPPSTIGGA